MKIERFSRQTGAVIYGVGLMAISTIFSAFVVYEMQSNPNQNQIVYWFLASLSVITFAWGWAGLSGIYQDKNGREAWWSIGRLRVKNNIGNRKIE